MRRLAAPALLAAALLLGAGSPPAPQAADLALLIDVDPQHELRLTAANLRRLPQAEERVSFEGEHGRTTATYAGVRLWTLLEQAGGLAAKPRDRVAKALFATGRDGYTAALALAELDPAFEGKPVLIATTADGHAPEMAGCGLSCRAISGAGAACGTWCGSLCGEREEFSRSLIGVMIALWRISD